MPTKKKTVTIHKKGKPAIKFKSGGLHASTHTPKGQKIPASKLSAAVHGSYGPKAKKEALFDKNVLSKGRSTAAKHKKKD